MTAAGRAGVIVRPNRRVRPMALSQNRRPGFTHSVWMADPADAPDPEDGAGDPLRTLALGVLLSAAADLRLRGDPHGMRDWLAGEDGAPWIEAALGGVAAGRIKERAADPDAWAAIVDRAAGHKLRSA